MKSNTALTLYNQALSNGAAVWYRTLVNLVEWENRKAANILRSGLLEADSVVVYIGFDQGANYVAPKAWQALVSKTGKWTLQVGDYIVKGNASESITAQFTLNHLLAKYDQVARISSVDTYDYGSAKMNHWQIGAK